MDQENNDDRFINYENNKNLKFLYNQFGLYKTIKPKKKLSQVISMNEHTINEILKKQTELNGLINKVIESNNNSITNTLESPVSPKKVKRSKRGSLLNVNSFRKVGLRRYRTFNDIALPPISNVANLNINININPIPKKRNSKQFLLYDNKKLCPNNEINSETNIENLEKNDNKKSDKMWKLSKNTIKMARGFKQHEVKKIEYETELDNDIEIFKKNKCTPNQFPKCESPSVQKFMNKSEMEKELNRMHLKQSVYKMIIDGCKDFKFALDEIFIKNQERFIYDSSHPKFLFNQLLPETKKTLLYTACQEGNFNIVDYFLNKKLNPKIKSKVNEDEYETCLDVAARWNYTDIVKLLLEKGNLTESDIKDTLRNKSLKKPVINLLEEYINKKEVKKSKGCACF